MGDVEQIKFILQVFESISSTGLLIAAVLMFYRGEIIPKSVLTRILENTNKLFNQEVKNMTAEIIEEIRTLKNDNNRRSGGLS